MKKPVLKWVMIGIGVFLGLGIIGQMVMKPTPPPETTATTEASTTTSTKSEEPAAVTTSAPAKAEKGIGVSHAEIKSGLESLDWKPSTYGIGFAQGGVTVAVNGPEDNATVVAVYIKASAEMATAQMAALAQILKNTVGRKAAATILTSIGRMMQGKEAGTEKSWTVGDNEVEFAYSPAEANLIVQIKPQ